MVVRLCIDGTLKLICVHSTRIHTYRGRVVNQTEWDDRLTKNFEWTRDLIEKHVRGPEAEANVVVIMAHATNSPNHRDFFHPMRDYIEFDLKNAVPILYLNGDVHSWNEQANYFQQSNWKRITVEGNTVAKPLKLTVDASDGVKTVGDAFSFVRFY
jgi:predicted anti-sigma-YlaC factor YlaD